jgi:molybdate transport system substrate-binding protein
MVLGIFCSWRFRWLTDNAQHLRLRLPVRTGAGRPSALRSIRPLQAAGGIPVKPTSPIRRRSTPTVLSISGAASAADVRVMISAGFYAVYSELGAAFEHATGHRLVTTRGPSMGDSPEAIPARLARGEAADVVIMDAGAADQLGRKGLIRADSKIALARSLIGMVVRAGAVKPDIGSVEALRSALLTAKSIAYSDSGSGTYLATTLFPKLGVADQVADKSRKVRGPPSGEPVAAVVARGEAEIGFQQVSELIHIPGIVLVGTIPAEVQPMTVFTGALTSTAQQPEAARALIRFLTSAEAASVIVRAGLMPVPART